MVVKNGILIVHNVYRISYEYTLHAHLISFSSDVIPPWNGYTTVSFIKVTTCVKLCLKVNLRLLASRLVGACLTFLRIFSFFIADEL